MTALLGGTASPVGWSVQYLKADVDTIIEQLREIHRNTDPTVLGPFEFNDLIARLPPFEAPWTREIVMPCGEWTAYLNNFVGGGDSSGLGPALARDLGIDCVVASNSPRHGPGHQDTLLSILGPTGEPPLMYLRTIAAHCADGRWSWHESGAPLSFEDRARYDARRIRDRFDRRLLLDYLEQLGIPAADDAGYGSGFVIQQHVSWPTRVETLEQARADLLGGG